jgi:hypothetical protein
MRLRPKKLLFTLFGMVHLSIPLKRAALDRTGCWNQTGIHESVSLEHQAFGDQGALIVAGN